MDEASAQQFYDAGAQFIVSPVTALMLPVSVKKK